MDYNYLDAVKDDVREYIKDNGIEVTPENIEELQEQLVDDLWAEDSVTGNGSGSYTFDTYKAEEYICHNLGLLGEALQEFGSDAANWLKQGAEACDVTIRCYLLPQAVAQVLEEMA